MDELDKRIRLEALITERAKMVARSRYHAHDADDAERDDEFDVLAGKMRQLLEVPPGAWLSLEQLEELDTWHGTDGIDIGLCPVCVQKGHHASNCWLNAKIKEARQGKG